MTTDEQKLSLETSEHADAEAATTGPCASPAGFPESMKQGFATAGRGKTSGPSAAMADCRRMFEQCMTGAAPAETSEPTPATVAAGSDTKEV